MKFSIATVSLGGTPAGEAGRDRRGRLRGRGDLRGRRARARGHARRDRQDGARRGLEIVAFQPFRDFEGMPEPQRTPRLRARPAQVRADERARRRRRSWSAPTSRRSASAASTGRPPTCASSARSPASFGIDVGFEALAWGRHVCGLSRRLGDRAPRRSSARRAHPRQLAHAGARPRARRGAVDPRRPHHLRPARRRAEDGHGPAAMVAALPQFPRAGRLAGRRLHAGGDRDRLRRLAQPRDLQRPLPHGARRGASPRTASAR